MKSELWKKAKTRLSLRRDLVGYNQKQVINYIRKLTKELDNLPYNYGGEFGYSMINDDLKTVEDALNEAVDAMKKQKREKNNEEEL